MTTICNGMVMVFNGTSGKGSSYLVWISEYPPTQYTDCQITAINYTIQNSLLFCSLFQYWKQKIFVYDTNVYVNTYASYGLKSKDCDNSLKCSAFSDTVIKK